MSRDGIPLASQKFGNRFAKRQERKEAVAAESTSKFLREFVNLELIGEGRYGCVFMTDNVLDEWKYAVKRISLKGKSDQEVSHALREVRLMAQFDHQGLVRYNSTWIEKPTGESVMLLRDREAEILEQSNLLCKYSLEHWLDRNRKRRDLEQMKNWFTQIVSAVEYIHKKGVIHRDLKPSNILFADEEDEDRLKICDLGIATESNEQEAKKLGNDSEQTPDRTSDIGTPLYMSPEQLSWGYHTEVDIFSMGLIFAEMCLPMTDKLKSEVFKDLKAGKCNADLECLPHDMLAFILWLTDKDSSRRPTCTEILTSFARSSVDAMSSNRIKTITKDAYRQLEEKYPRLKKISCSLSAVEITDRRFTASAEVSVGPSWLLPSFERYHQLKSDAKVPASLIYELRAEVEELERRMARELAEKRRTLEALEKFRASSKANSCIPRPSKPPGTLC